MFGKNGSVDQLIASMAARELAIASVVGSLANKIEEAPVGNNWLEELSVLRALTCEILRISADCDKQNLGLLQLLLKLSEVDPEHTPQTRT